MSGSVRDSDLVHLRIDCAPVVLFYCPMGSGESDTSFRSVVEASPMGIHLYELREDDRLVFVGANPAAERILGVSHAAFVGKTIEEAFPALVGGEVPDRYREVARDGATWRSEQVDYDEGGIRGAFEVVAFQTEPGKVAAIFNDITERKRAEEARLALEERLQQSQRLEALGVLAGGIAHDFNNLMGGVFGFIDLAMEQSRDVGVRGHLVHALGALERAHSLTRQLLTFAKGGSPAREEQRLFPFVQEAAQFALTGSNVSCAFSIADDLWACAVDRNQIAQVIDNIVINARQAMPGGGGVTLTAVNRRIAEGEHPSLAAGDYVRLSVSDEGIGIPREIIGRIFDPFYTTKEKGHGLGLATCHSIVHRHGGCIDVESVAGKGSAFHIYLPAACDAQAGEAPSPPMRHVGRGTMMVVDDDEVIRSVMRAQLESLGYQVLCAPHGRAALDLLATETAAGRPLAGIIFDLTIPGGMGGCESIGEVRRVDPQVPVFVASGYADDPVMASPAAFGFTDSLRKPFLLRDLAEMLERQARR